ncbi:MAG TPA: RES domain-containing protein, partial [Polyangiaceae bacterium]
KPPFEAHVKALASKTSYEATHALGSDMRAAGVEVFLYTSARSIEPGTNVGLFVPSFARKAPKKTEAWICTADRTKVELAEKSFAGRRAHRFAFPRTAFVVKGKLPAPSV